MNGLTLLLLAVAASGVTFGLAMLKAYRHAEEQEQLLRREAEHFQRVLHRAVHLGRSYDEALASGDSVIRPLLQLKLEAISRQAQGMDAVPAGQAHVARVVAR